MKKVSVIIPTYNSWDTLRSCISSIQQQSVKPKEIIVVDNASTDGTTVKVKKMFPKVKLSTLNKNTGVTGGRNMGIKKTSSDFDYLLFFDHDMVADKDMLKQLIQVTAINSDIGIVTPKIYYFGDKKRIWSAGTGINLWSGQIIFRGGQDVGQFDEVVEVQVAPAAILVKQEVIKRLKKFDDTYFTTYEDTDFCFRAKRAGFKTYYAPKALAFHKLPTDFGEESKRLLSRSYWIGRNRVIFMKRFGRNFSVFILFIPLFIIYYLILALRNNKFHSWLSFAKGTLDGLLHV